jgi:hypothetical protein
MQLLSLIILTGFAFSNLVYASETRSLDLDQAIAQMEKALNWLPRKEIQKPEVVKKEIQKPEVVKKEIQKPKVVKKEIQKPKKEELLEDSNSFIMAPTKEPELLVKNYKRYNIIFYDGNYYGVNLGEGAIDVRSLNIKAQLPWAKASTRQELKVMIDVLVGEEGDMGDPILIEQGFRGHNIVLYNDLFHGVNQQEGPIDIRDIKNQSKLPWATAPTLPEIKTKIAQLILDAEYNTPFLVEQNYKYFNIVKLKKTFYGVDQQEGPIDVKNLKALAKHKWFSDENLDNLKKKIDVTFDKRSFKLKVRWQLSKMKRNVTSFIKDFFMIKR